MLRLIPFVAASLALALPATVRAASLTGSSDRTELVRAAIVRSVQERMGKTATVEVTLVDVRVAASDAVKAVPDAGARVGGPMRFLLVDAAGADRVGSADAVVMVSVPHLRARQPIPRRTALSAAVVEAADGDVGRVPLQRLPRLEDLRGATAARDLQPGALVTSASVNARMLVRSGDEVTTFVRMGPVEARGRAVASGSAALGEEVRLVVNRRALRGRVVGDGEVEIQP